MKSYFGALAGALTSLAVVAVASAADAPPPPEGTIYNTTFVEVAASAVPQTTAMLKAYRDAARKEPGAMGVDLYEETGTRTRFVTNEVWKDWAAYQAHTNARARTDLYNKLKPIQFGPPDARTHTGHFISPEGPKAGAGAVFILSHLDVTPPAVPKLLELMQPLSENSAKEKGVVTYQILRQNPGTNHFRLFEVWASDAAWNAHNLSAHTQTFRNEVAPLLGTPYDQRKYNIVK